MGVLIWALLDEASYEYDYALNEQLGVHRTAKEGYIYNRETKEKVISDVELIGEPHNRVIAFGCSSNIQSFHIG